MLPTLQQLPNLEVLLIEQNGLSGPHRALMVEVLMGKPNFHHLSLSGNRDMTPSGSGFDCLVKAKASMLVLDGKDSDICGIWKILKRLLQERLAHARGWDIMIMNVKHPVNRKILPRRLLRHSAE